MERKKIKKLKTPRSPQTVGRQSKAKGSQFERDICKLLSKWWTGSDRDDVFYRTGASGGRATNRAAKGATTANSAGDIGYLDALGAPLMEAFTFELKKGYPSNQLQRLIDQPPVPKPDNLIGWFKQAAEGMRLASSKTWAVVHGPPRRPILVYTPWAAFKEIAECPSAGRHHGPVAVIDNLAFDGYAQLAVMTLERFLAIVTPGAIREWLEDLGRDAALGINQPPTGPSWIAKGLPPVTKTFEADK